MNRLIVFSFGRGSYLYQVIGDPKYVDRVSVHINLFHPGH